MIIGRLLAKLLADRPRTLADVRESITAGYDDVTAMADFLDVETEQLKSLLAELTGAALLADWDDNGITRYRVTDGRSAG